MGSGEYFPWTLVDRDSKQFYFLCLIIVGRDFKLHMFNVKM